MKEFSHKTKSKSIDTRNGPLLGQEKLIHPENLQSLSPRDQAQSLMAHEMEKVIMDSNIVKGITKAAGIAEATDKCKLQYIIPFSEQHSIPRLLSRLEHLYPNHLVAIEMATLENAYIRIVE